MRERFEHEGQEYYVATWLSPRTCLMFGRIVSVKRIMKGNGRIQIA